MSRKNRHLTVAAAAGAVALAVVLITSFSSLSIEKGTLLPRLFKGTKTPVREGQGGELRVATTDLLGLFNPAFSTAKGDRTVSSFVFEPFMKQGPKGQLEPCTVTQAVIPEDGSSMKLILQEGLRFSDGSEATALDAAASVIAQALSPEKEISAGYDRIEGIDEFRNGSTAFPAGLTIEDQRTLTIRFSQPSPDNLSILSTPLQKGSFVQPPKEGGQPNASEAAGQLNAISRGGIGTGPYLLVPQDEPGYTAELVRSPQYPQGDVEKILVSHTTYTDIAETLGSGEGQTALYDVYSWEQSPQLLTAAEQSKSYDVYMKPGSSIYSLVFSESNPELEDVRLRRAMALMIRENAGTGGLVPEDFAGFMLPSARFSRTQACAEAREQGVKFSALSGWKSSSSKEAKALVKELSREGMVLSYDLPVIEDNEVQTALASEVSAILGKCGITVNVIPKSAEEYQSDCIMGRGYDILLSSITLPESAAQLRELYESPSSITRLMGSERQLEALSKYEKAYSMEAVMAARQELFSALEADVPFVPLARKTELIAVAADLKGYSLSEHQMLLGNVQDIRMK